MAAGEADGQAVRRSSVDFGQEAETFRAAIRQWIADEAPAGLARERALSVLEQLRRLLEEREHG